MLEVFFRLKPCVVDSSLAYRSTVSTPRLPMSESTPHYAFVYVPGGEGGDFYAAFIQVCGADATICGVAPCGFSPSPLAEVQVPLGAEEATQGLVPAEFVEIPLSDILGLVPEPPQGVSVMMFAPDSSLPCADACSTM